MNSSARVSFRYPNDGGSITYGPAPSSTTSDPGSRAATASCFSRLVNVSLLFSCEPVTEAKHRVALADLVLPVGEGVALGVRPWPGLDLGRNNARLYVVFTHLVDDLVRGPHRGLCDGGEFGAGPDVAATHENRVAGCVLARADVEVQGVADYFSLGLRQRGGLCLTLCGEKATGACGHGPDVVDP